MADLYVKNSLNSNLAVKFNITLRYFVIKREDGEHHWVLEIGTTHKGIGGTTLPSVKVHNISSSNLDKVIEESVSKLASMIDWSPLELDKDAPYLVTFSPIGDGTPMESNVHFTIKESLPSAGIDLSSVKVYFNNGFINFDISNELHVIGDPYEYLFEWKPHLKVYKRYNS